MTASLAGQQLSVSNQVTSSKTESNITTYSGALFVSWADCSRARNALTLVSGGRTKYSIFLDSSASPLERWADDELRRPLEAATARNEVWALDFVSDSIANGRRIRLLNVADAYRREYLALEVDTSFASRRVKQVLDGIIAERGAPRRIRCDNGPEPTSRHFLAWSTDRRIDLLHVRPGKPTQNGRLESLNGKLRDEFLNVSWFQNLFNARRQAELWRRDYNDVRPHSALGYRTSAAFAAGPTASLRPPRWGGHSGSRQPCGLASLGLAPDHPHRKPILRGGRSDNLNDGDILVLGGVRIPGQVTGLYQTPIAA